MRCWGYGSSGQLGYSNTTTIGDNETPASAGDVQAGGSVAIKHIAAGYRHTCSLLSSGKVRCWGDGEQGRLGYGNTVYIGDNETPASAGDVNVGGDVVQLTAGGYHTCALLSNGKVRCWGWGQYGEDGNGFIVGDNETPASVGYVSIGGDVKQLAADEHNTCALLSNGKVRCWGYNFYGQLGYVNTSNVSNPSSAGDVNIGGDVKQITVGSYHACALLSNGKMRCWGYGGRLGYGNANNIGDDETPASAGDVNVGGDVRQMAANSSHTCALLSSGKVRCWGYNAFGQLGYGNPFPIGDNETPSSVGDVSIGGDATQLAAGESHSCALLSTGKVRCWGLGINGQLGYGDANNIGDIELPATAGDISIGGDAIQITGGQYHTCALLSNGNMRCWGGGNSGQLGYGNTNNIGDNELPSVAGDVAVW